MDLKEGIIQSAYELFSTKGYEQTTIEGIIKKAKCSKGGFYHHFKSKEEILEVIIANYIDELSKYFEDIISKNPDTFIDKFNTIFMVISQYKLQQFIGWSNINNIFVIAGNDRVLRELEKQFKIATTGAYLEVIRIGKEQGIINAEYPEILAEFCTREVLWIYEEARKFIYPDDHKNHDLFEKLLNFSEGLINHALGLNKSEVRFKSVALSYLQDAREIFRSSKEGL